MNASKEAAQDAIDNVELWFDAPAGARKVAKRDVLAFLQAAKRKLPTEAAYAKDRKRKPAKPAAAK
jgi:hypothetical protein